MQKKFSLIIGIKIIMSIFRWSYELNKLYDNNILILEEEYFN